VLVRVVWGFVGPACALRRLRTRAAAVFANLRDIVLLRPRRYLGHSPAGGAMVLLLLAMLAATTVTGILSDQSEDGATRTALVTPAAADGRQREYVAGHEESPLVEAHEALANLTLALVVLHIGGVIVASFTHRENLIASMFTGRKRTGTCVKDRAPPHTYSAS
jgi:cytochrome b